MIFISCPFCVHIPIHIINIIGNLKHYININKLILAININLFLKSTYFKNFYYKKYKLHYVTMWHINIIFYKLLETFVVTSTIVVILEYILGYSFDKYHESYHYIYVVYTHKIYCSTHWYIIYNTKKE
ncbi:hypothetical protein PFFVO_06191 [Plasmodium falciparum Vietnam Oak-Knoll (FVO)]|uniref:Uncharacterized protein n=1 Tax=Plasmodium falciparum Vietnam Oak-Knoll (FVO) TaxID=1036723 RepID=A0A024UXC2_PLAFA|nr:hypothetical protein PFFVO_06191 [Plasmodium falciparum Vietnam Oak-Knoll (FVO)]